MRIGLTMLAAGLVVAWMGGRGVYEAVASGKQQTMTYTQFNQKHPGMGWYKVSGAAWDLEDCMYVTRKQKYSQDKEVKTVFLPLHASNVAPDPTGKISVVLETERKDLCDVIQNAENSGGSGAMPPANLMHYSGNIDGMVAFGGDIDSKSRDLLQQKLGSALAPNYVVIRDGKKPNAGTGALMLVGGIVLAGLGGVVLANRS